MDKLPDQVKSALTAACNLGKGLSWKVQESLLQGDFDPARMET